MIEKGRTQEVARTKLTRAEKIQKYMTRKVTPSGYFKSGRVKGLRHELGKGYLHALNEDEMSLLPPDEDGWYETINAEDAVKYKVYRYGTPMTMEQAAEAGLDKVTDEGFTEKFDLSGSTMVQTLYYDPKLWVMKADFVNQGDVVIYTRVPPQVFAQLQDRAKDSGFHHVGGAFWQLIRTNHCGVYKRTGSKYNYVYWVRGERKGKRTSEKELMPIVTQKKQKAPKTKEPKIPVTLEMQRIARENKKFEEKAKLKEQLNKATSSDLDAMFEQMRQARNNRR